VPALPGRGGLGVGRPRRVGAHGLQWGERAVRGGGGRILGMGARGAGKGAGAPRAGRSWGLAAAPCGGTRPTGVGGECEGARGDSVQGLD